MSICAARTNYLRFIINEDGVKLNAYKAGVIEVRALLIRPFYLE